MGKQHEILAVEPNKEGIAKKIVDETNNVFRSKHNLFTGGQKTLKMNVESDANLALEKTSAEITLVETTVPERLDYTHKALVDWFDCTFQKEVTNCTDAKADIIVDGVIIAEQIPATFLLGLENRLKGVREMYLNIPTLAPGVVWEVDDSKENVFRAANVDVRSKTAKKNMHAVMYEATPEHPAQIDKWTEDVVVGVFTTSFTSGMLPAKDKAEVLSRVDKLIQAVKQARMRANSVKASTRKIGAELFDYINNG